jgi:hypothetical protein
MGFWRGYRVWDVWAELAFTIWECDHLPQWQGYLPVYPSGAPDRGSPAAATRLTEPSRKAPHLQKRSDLRLQQSRAFLSMYWAIGCLKTPL